MEIKTTYIGFNSDGKHCIWCGFKPENATITKEYNILYPDRRKILKHKESGKECEKVVLTNINEKNDYEEIDGETNNDLTI